MLAREHRKSVSLIRVSKRFSMVPSVIVIMLVLIRQSWAIGVVREWKPDRRQFSLAPISKFNSCWASSFPIRHRECLFSW
jgi:hypothetical protein